MSACTTCPGRGRLMLGEDSECTGIAMTISGALEFMLNGQVHGSDVIQSTSSVATLGSIRVPEPGGESCGTLV